MEAVGKHVFPAQAAKLQKRYLRRFVRKPMGMTSRMFVARVQELNNYLPHPPSHVLVGEPIQKLDDDEIIDLLEFDVLLSSTSASKILRAPVKNLRF